VNRIYTDLAVIEVTPNGFRLVELSPGIDFDFVQEYLWHVRLCFATRNR
jgi:acyl CoA:acetate/3-ketoacid CoA transferase beta subunit